MAEKTKSSKASGKIQKSGAVKPAKKKAGETSTAMKPLTKLDNQQKRTATFRLDAPYAAQVFVAGSFNDWSPVATPLVRDEAGTWTGTVNIYPGEYEYRFVVDGVWADDPANMMRRCNEFGTENCILAVKS